MKRAFILSLVTVLAATAALSDDRTSTDRTEKSPRPDSRPAEEHLERDRNARVLDRRYWRLDGNSGTRAGEQFLGTTDNQPLELKVNSQRVLRLEPTVESPNLIGGLSENGVGEGPWAVGNTISGGGRLGLPNRIPGSASYATIGGGAGNIVEAYGSTISGGVQNRIDPLGDSSVIAGGLGNRIATDNPNLSIGLSFIGGGYLNTIQSIGGVIGGGQNNLIEGVSDSTFQTIGGGALNTIQFDAYGSTIGGGWRHTVRSNSVHSFIGGGHANEIAAPFGTIAGGLSNVVGGPYGTYGTIGGGEANVASGGFATVGGGQGNISFNVASTVAGGSFNIAREPHSTVGGGQDNVCYGEDSTVGGGAENSAYGDGTTVGGGQLNVATGKGATVPGGFDNYAVGRFSFAAGCRSVANQDGSFVWADLSTRADSGELLRFVSETTNEFAVRATGGVRFVSGIGPFGGVTAGVNVPPGGGAWSSLSDRNAKANLSPASGREILEKVVALPVSTWNYKTQDEMVRHIGPMAQDFHAAFGVGEDERRISTVDADGVALAAIQGLNQKMEERLRAREEEIENLRKRLEQLEQIVAAANLRRE